MADDLVLKLVTASHAESVRLSNELADSRERAGFNGGFEYGLMEGERRFRNRLLGLLCLDAFPESECEEWFEAWKQRQRERIG